VTFGLKVVQKSGSNFSGFHCYQLSLFSVSLRVKTHKLGALSPKP
jgi:hypothetical protein